MNGKFLFLSLFTGVLSIIGFSDNSLGLGTLFMFLAIIFLAMAMAFKKEPQKKGRYPDKQPLPEKAAEEIIQEKKPSPPELSSEIVDREPVIEVETPKAQPINDEPIRCPKCGSAQISANKKGFGVGKAVGGVLLTGGVGLLGGFIGSKKVLLTCLKCGKQWQPGEK